MVLLSVDQVLTVHRAVSRPVNAPDPGPRSEMMLLSVDQVLTSVTVVLMMLVMHVVMELSW